MRLQLFALAYDLGNFLRWLALPRKVRLWSMTTLKRKLIKIGAKVVRQSRTSGSAGALERPPGLPGNTLPPRPARCMMIERRLALSNACEVTL